MKQRHAEELLSTEETQEVLGIGGFSRLKFDLGFWVMINP